MLPLLYKFGAERAKVLFYAVLAGLALTGFLVFQYLGGMEALDSLEESPVLVVLPFLGALVLFALSAPISYSIYQKKDLQQPICEICQKFSQKFHILLMDFAGRLC